MVGSTNTAGNTNRSGGIGFVGLLTVLFIGLRLGGIIDWNWWWVLSPIWIAGGVSICILLGVVLFLLKTKEK